MPSTASATSSIDRSRVDPRLLAYRELGAKLAVLHRTGGAGGAEEDRLLDALDDAWERLPEEARSAGRVPGH